MCGDESCEINIIIHVLTIGTAFMCGGGQDIADSKLMSTTQHSHLFTCQQRCVCD